MKRRTFLELAGLGVANQFLPHALSSAVAQTAAQQEAASSSETETFGSGHFGTWHNDVHGLPAYHYTCNQLTDPLAAEPVDKVWRSPTDHMHQLGNNRIVAIASNYGHLQVRQDEGSPKFLNDFFPEQSRFGAGIGFLADDAGLVLSTYYTGAPESFDRVFGMGYLQKRVAAKGYTVDQVLFAPYGDDPVLVSQVTITNHSTQAVSPRWIEYWGCSNYQFSYRSLMESGVIPNSINAVERRRKFAGRFSHKFELLPNNIGLLERQTFLGRTSQEEDAWRQTQALLTAKGTGFFGGTTPSLAPGASMDDLAPPPTFLASLNGSIHGHSTDASAFFRGGIEHPQGASRPLDGNLSTSGVDSAFLLEHQLQLKPGESKTLYFLYGYLPQGVSLSGLLIKYSAKPSSLWSESCKQWKSQPAQFSTSTHPWIEREAAWSNYYLRSGLTYDSFFHEHILSQGAGYQYLAGLQGAARDPLQHILPFLFTDPALVRGIIRYTLKEMQQDGYIPYGIVGQGVPMPCVYRPSDLQLWVLWVTTEYVLATRDEAFLRERVPTYPQQEPSANSPTVLELLKRAFHYLDTTVGIGQHGLMRIFNGDWNDSIVYTHLTPEQAAETVRVGESVLNAAMATYVFDYYAQLLDHIGDKAAATGARAKAQQQREAVQTQWYGQWYRRAWLSEDQGWVGEKQMWLEPQPWALIGNCVPKNMVPTLVTSIDTLMRKPSRIGALLQSQPDPTMKDEPGTGTNGGIFASINGTLIWALAQVNGDMAWEEWKKNTLAVHAENYPNMWFGIWSGPDAYHSSLSKRPGGTGVDFPVLNMHSHAWPLYTVTKLLGTEFHPEGIRFKPVIPLDEYDFHTPLLRFKKTQQGYSGWYAPSTAGLWTIDICLPQADLNRLHSLTINDLKTRLPPSGSSIRIRGASKPGNPLRWSIS